MDCTLSDFAEASAENRGEALSPKQSLWLAIFNKIQTTVAAEAWLRLQNESSAQLS